MAMTLMATVMTTTANDNQYNHIHTWCGANFERQSPKLFPFRNCVYRIMSARIYYCYLMCCAVLCVRARARFGLSHRDQMARRKRASNARWQQREKWRKHYFMIPTMALCDYFCLGFSCFLLLFSFVCDLYEFHRTNLLNRHRCSRLS